MMSHMPRRISTFLQVRHFKEISRGKKTKGKTKLSYGKHKDDPTEIALKHFDQNYRPLFGDQWPSIRLALLSMQSSGALLNNYSDVQETVDRLHSIGVEDFVQPHAGDVKRLRIKRETKPGRLRGGVEDTPEDAPEDAPENGNGAVEESISNPGSTGLDDLEVARKLQEREMLVRARDEDELEEGGDFGMGELEVRESRQPTKPWWDGRYIVATGYEHRMDLVQQLELEERGHSELVSEPSGANPIKVMDADLEISPHLRCFMNKSSFKRLPQAKRGSEEPNLQYYIMDPASVLPVLAMDVRTDDVVLDLCAGPGGKSVAILQTMLISTLTANEKVLSRKRRLQEVLGLCLPRSIRTSGAIRVSGLDGCEWGQIEPMAYDKVLVDVPCSTDRVSATQADNNLFKVSRSRERWDLPELQTDLLCAGLQAVKPGGTVVYSTCTMSPLQNDGVVQNAITRCQEEFNISTSVADLSPLARAYRDVFSFFPNCRYGQLVVPRISANYGPMYFSRLIRTR
ncbi:5-methylcytosine rRNA methyltransferase NSUN4 isoform X1 [Strongylocentrotus purpuratus]|uniref:NOL1/NOP2/Sun domain family member 4 n=2 Tax=Strongylocentrotus purpuratus TaxID=7668 RepID=A0A7M7RDJ1_STRPU|nr:5-methylcytosine rRNA methyltransferase NSUN4 isoform X1 [Strongylocentrotus purpuratus]